MLVQRSFQPPPLPTRRVVSGHVILALARHVEAQLLEGGDHAGPVLLRIPDDLEHRFRAKVNTHSGQVEHRFREGEHRFRPS